MSISVEAQQKGFFITQNKEGGDFVLFKYSKFLEKDEYICKFPSIEEAEEYIRDNY